MDSRNATLSPQLLAATEALAVNLRQSEQFVLYHQVRGLLETDAQAQALLRSLSEAQAEVRVRQARGEVTQSDIDQLRALQHAARANRVIMENARAQQSAIEYLREINQEISGLLGVDFASLARRPGCC
jgi:cell fate (sporulation/competence/biofilm development) regulator YlbF (YheA/YmcA/DUF963 family)